jgi:hypothetical protein
LYQLRMMTVEHFGGMQISRGNRNSRRKILLVPFVHHKSYMTNLVSNPASRQLTAWALWHTAPTTVDSLLQEHRNGGISYSVLNPEPSEYGKNHIVPNHPSPVSHLLQKYIKIIVYKTALVRICLYSCETVFLTLRGEQGAGENIWTWKGGGNCVMTCFIIWILCQTLLRCTKSRRMRWLGHVECMTGMKNAHKILFGEPEGNHLGDLTLDGESL